MPWIRRFWRSKRANTEPIIYKTVVSTEAPKLHLDEIFSPNMGLQGLNNYLLDPVPAAQQQNGISQNGVTETPRGISIQHTTPSRPAVANPRRTLPEHSDNDPHPSSLQISPVQVSPTTDNGSPWSSAVGRATTGKSGRVIERLMAENDRLQREMNLAQVRLDEENRRSESARSALEALRSTNENLAALHEMNISMLAKRERRIEETKTELEAERQRRERAEREAKEARRDRDEAVDRYKREAIVERENSRRATAQYDVLSISLKRLEDGYGRQTRKLEADVKSLQNDIVADQQKLTGLRTITDQIRSESQKSQTSQQQLIRGFDAYKAETERGLEDIREEAGRNADANDQVQKEMQSVLGEMRHVINVKRDVRGID